MEETYKPRIVITSTQAKNHIFKAKSLLDEMDQGIMMQQRKIQEQKMQNDQLQRDDQRFVAQNNHNQMMQSQKLAATKVMI